MPTIFIRFGYVFKFYSNEHEPIHIHVLKDGKRAKYHLFPVKIIENQGFKATELRLLELLIDENKELIAEQWNSFFNLR